MNTISRRLLPETVTVEPFLGSGAYGPVFGTPVSYPARVVREAKLVRNSDGQEVVSSATVFVKPSVQCPPGSRITLPGESEKRTTSGYAPHVGARDVHHVTIDVT